jgi:hypothetical protein
MQLTQAQIIARLGLQGIVYIRQNKNTQDLHAIRQIWGPRISAAKVGGWGATA